MGVIPREWAVEALGELAATSSGTTPPRALHERYYRNGTHFWVKTLDLNNSFITQTEERMTESALKDTSLRLFPPGTVLLAMYGGFNQIGRTGLLKVPACVNQAITAIRTGRDRLRPEFLLYVLNYRVSYWRTVASSSRRDPNITGRDAREFLLAVPNVPEQEAIAAALSDADALIGSLENLIAKKRAIKQGAMQELLSGRRRLAGFSDQWKEQRFGNVFEFLPTATNSRSDLSEDGDSAYVHYGDIHTRFRNILDFSRTSLPLINRSRCPNAALLKNGDWIMADASEDFDGVAKSVEVSGLRTGEIAVSGLHTFLLRERKQTFAPGFKGFLGNAQFLRKQYLRVMTGMKVFGVSKAALRDLVMPIPDWKEQEAIRDVLNDMSDELTALEVRLANARQIEQAMMQELLTGRIRLI